MGRFRLSSYFRIFLFFFLGGGAVICDETKMWTFFIFQNDQGIYQSKVRDMISENKSRLIVNINDLRRRNDVRAAKWANVQTWLPKKKKSVSCCVSHWFMGCWVSRTDHLGPCARLNCWDDICNTRICPGWDLTKTFSTLILIVISF